MKKLYLSFFLVAAFVFYVLLSKGPDSYTYNTPPAAVGSGNPAAGVGGGDVAGNSPSSFGMGMMDGSGMMRGGFKNGEYTGKAADAYYGNVQVKATVGGGKLTDVQFLDYPRDRSTSLRISGESMPLLKQEAIQAQSAQVDGVSGATQTSNAFVESLDSALAQAKI